MSREKKNYSATFKVQVILELLRGDRSLNELAEQYQITITPTTLSARHKVFQVPRYKEWGVYKRLLL